MTTGKHRWRRRGAVGAVVVLLLLVVGYLAAPALLGHLIVSRLSEKTGHEVAVGDVAINPFTAEMTIDDFSLAGRMTDQAPLFAAQQIRLALAWSSLWHAGWRLQAVELQQPRLSLAINKQGDFNIAQLFPDTGGPPPQIRIDRLTTHDGTLSWRNRSRQPAGHLTLEQVALDIRHYDHAGDQPFELQGSAQAGDGTLQVDGRMGFSPWLADLDYQGRNIALATFSPWLNALMQARIRQGHLNARGHFSAGEAADGALQLQVASGKLVRPELRAPEAETSLFSADAISVRTLHFGSRQGLAVQQLSLASPRLHAVILPGMKTNLSALTPPSHASDQQHEGQNGADADSADHDSGEGSGQHFRFDRVRVQDGQLQFTDRHLEQSFQLNIRQLEGELTGPEGSDSPGRVNLDGRVNDTAPISIRGQFAPLTGALSGDLRLQAEHLPLTSFAPYIRRFGGYAVEGGTVRLDLNYRVDQGQLDANNHIILRQLDLGRQVRAGSTDLPLQKLIGLLQAESGVINLDIPVRASLDGTSLDVSRVVWQAVGEAFENLLTSPVDTLSAMFGNEGADQGSDAASRSGGNQDAERSGYSQGPLSSVPLEDAE
ncbi:uncharacterized protein DUF748 [Kushneria sinocarnis]|uniref:Uncharacterized protein DUF748 n=1 Tax=Kushneria sinocarnis TaxID=595502 RepID=A0A420WUA9_9GAMM|nr:DUF748 domain-containing protein [Kushneria sinocarnis]RKQ97025.1 uncharacterized protein DUF748 [Kushneria sinocarnis]